jgi:hypothetical protein
MEDTTVIKENNLPRLKISKNAFINLHYYYTIVGLIILAILIIEWMSGGMHIMSVVTFGYAVSLIYLSYNNLLFNYEYSGK